MIFINEILDRPCLKAAHYEEFVNDGVEKKPTLSQQVKVVLHWNTETQEFQAA